MAITFRFAGCDEYAGLSRFLHEYWAKDHAYCRMPSLFEWTFRRSTHWPDTQYSFAMAEDEGKLAGILGGIPFTFNAFGKESSAMWIVNYVISPEHRKGTLALQLLSQFRKPEFDPVVAFGITQASTVIYKVLRGEVLPEMPRQILLLPEHRNRFADLLTLVKPEWEAARVRELTEAFVRPISSESAPKYSCGIPERWDQIDWPAFAQSSIGAARNAGYLDWRYRQHPIFDYKFLAVADGLRTGLLVWRLETIRRQTDEGRVDVDRIGRLVEFLPSSEDNAHQLLAVFKEQLRASGAFGADYYGFHGETRRRLEQSGFVLTSGHPDGNAIPTRFQPLDGKSGALLSAIFLKQSLPKNWDAADCPWYWTKSDSDQDRPN